MTILHAVLVFVLAQRAGELILARANTARLMRLGAVEIDRRGHKYFVAMHAAWFIAMFAAIPPDTPPDWPLLAAFLALQAGRVWVIASLGRRWTTRLIVLPGAPLVAAGPYRWLRHPNYLIVAGEVAILPLAFAAVVIVVGFSACNALLLIRRVRLEDAALGRQPSHSRNPVPP